MTEQKYIVSFNGEHLVFFFGDLDGEIVGIVNYIVRTPEHSTISLPQEPAR